MGWWSTCVMGGDTPYDIAVELEQKLGLSDLHMPDHFNKGTRRAIVLAVREYGGIEKLLTDTISAFRDEEDHPIVAQVVALIAICAGVPLTDEDKNLFLGLAVKDEWINGDESRKFHIDQLCEMIRAYDGTPVRVNQEGLFEVMMRRKLS